MSDMSDNTSNDASSDTAPEETGLAGAEEHTEDLANSLRATDLFSTLDAALLRELAAELTVVSLSSDETLIRQGEVGDSMYVVLEGRLRVIVEDEAGQAHFRRLVGVHETIGEIALLTGQTRTATIVADAQVTVARLSKVKFEQLTSRSPHVAQALATAITTLIQRRQLQNALNNARLFKTMDRELRQALESELEVLSLQSGERLFRQGDAGDGMYIIISGRLRIVLEDGEQKDEQREDEEIARPDGQAGHLLRTLGRGETLGEISLLTQEPRTATVYAIRDTAVARLSLESYERLVKQFPMSVTRTFTQPITQLVVSRDRHDNVITDTTLTMVLVPTSPDVLLSEFSQRFAKALALLGPTLHLNSRRVDTILGKEGIAQTTFAEDELERSSEHSALNVQLVNWLGEHESEYRFLLYEADLTYTPWTQRAVRQADHVILVGHGNGDPRLGELERTLSRYTEHYMSKEHTLVLLHRGGQRSAPGTARWLSDRQVHNHYHVRWHGAHEDFERLARILGGAAVGLVLSGGAARGAAHIGVLRALQEAGITVDMIGGVSAGSKIGALYAMGYDLETIQQQFTWLSNSVNPFLSVTIPVVSISTGAVMSRQFQRVFGDIQIEDLFLPYFCLSANLSRAEYCVHHTGDLWRASRASTTVPGIMPPLVHDGDLLIDGGLYNNLPIDVMRTRNPKGTVIGVDVMPAVDLADVASYGASLSGLQALIDRFVPGRRKSVVPNIASLLYRTLEVSSIKQIHEHLHDGLADLYLRPPVSEFGFIELGAIDRISEIGYRYAQEKLAQWKRGSDRYETE